MSTCSIGVIATADRGTLFLDEIGGLPADLQPRFLRVLQSGEYLRLGSTRAETADVRVIAATNRDLQRDVGDGRFRADLFFRLAAITIHLPPLRDRCWRQPAAIGRARLTCWVSAAKGCARKCNAWDYLRRARRTRNKFTESRSPAHDRSATGPKRFQAGEIPGNRISHHRKPAPDCLRHLAGRQNEQH